MKRVKPEQKDRKNSQNKLNGLYSILKSHTNKAQHNRQSSKVSSKSYSQSFNKDSRYKKQSKNNNLPISPYNLQNINKNQQKKDNYELKKISSSLNQNELSLQTEKQSRKNRQIKIYKSIQKGPFQLPNRSLNKKHLISNFQAKSVKQNRSISYLGYESKENNSFLKKQRQKQLIKKVVLSSSQIKKTKNQSHKSLISEQKKNILLEKHELNECQFKYKYTYRTRKGQQINNPKKVNQDSLLVKENIGKMGIHLFAVADGHGPHGHFVSQHIIKSLSKLVSHQISTQLIKQNDHPQNQIQIYSILPKIYDQIQDELTCSTINASASGSTLVNVIIHNSTVLCANVGDSRAILARQIDKKNWEVVYLSQDHKPDNQSEQKRIMKKGGRVHPFRDNSGHALGPARVWLPNQNIQGLAMSRSFGDNISKSIGVIHNPEMIKVNLDKNSKFLLLASDGVWQFISNQQILQLIVPYYRQNKLEQASDALLKLAYQRWTVDDDSVVDDITFVLIFFE